MGSQPLPLYRPTGPARTLEAVRGGSEPLPAWGVPGDSGLGGHAIRDAVPWTRPPGRTRLTATRSEEPAWQIGQQAAFTTRIHETLGRSGTLA